MTPLTAADRLAQAYDDMARAYASEASTPKDSQGDSTMTIHTDTPTRLRTLARNRAMALAGVALVIAGIGLMPTPSDAAGQTKSETIKALRAEVRELRRETRTAMPTASKPCAQEDGPGPCYWDAGKRGNGRGLSYVIDADQMVHYLDGGKVQLG